MTPATTDPTLAQQVLAEYRQIVDAPQLPATSANASARCHWCGRLTADPVLVEVVNGVERYKGGECCGRHP